LTLEPVQCIAVYLNASSIELAYIHWALGNDEQSRASLQEAIQIKAGFSPWGGKYAAAHQAKIDLSGCPLIIRHFGV
jgi:hypothetical protein